MTMVVSITCDGCEDYAEASTSFEGASSDIETELDAGWTHTSTEDLCPKCAPA